MRNAFFLAIAIVVLFCLYFWYMVAHTMYDIAREKNTVFRSDGCTLFFDGTWAECCMTHDREYWQGGSANLRYQSDKSFARCVYEKTNNQYMSLGSYGIVRLFGMPYVATPWRWGYGWKFGRGYR